MNKLLVRLARQSPAMIVAMLALFVALTGTAVATTSALIGSAQIRNNSITGLDVKNRSLRPIDFRGSVRGPRGLRGLTGATGATGSPGATGPKGDKGDKGADFTIATTLQPGQTETGVFGAWGRAATAGGYMVDSVNFRVPLASDLPANRDVFVPEGVASAPHCPGIGQAEAGYLCLYEVAQGNSTFVNAFDPTDGGDEISKLGFNVYYDFDAAGAAWSYGQWAVTAPAGTASSAADAETAVQNPN